MDLSSLDLKSNCESSARMTIKHPVTGKNLTDDKDEVFYLEFIGCESEFARNAKFKHDRKMSEINTNMEDNSPAKDDAIIYANAVMASEILTGWYLIKDGKPLEFSKEEAVKVFNQFYWLAVPLFREHGNLRNFTKA